MKATALALILTSIFCVTNPAFAKEAAKSKGEEIEVSIPKYITGGVLGTTVGFGIGHAVQGRYAQKGWLFTMLEGISVAMIIIGGNNCPGDGSSTEDDDDFDDWDFPRLGHVRTMSSSCPGAPAILLGIGGAIGFHIWEIVDVWSAPKYDKTRRAFYAGSTGNLNFGITAAEVDGKALPALAFSWSK